MDEICGKPTLSGEPCGWFTGPCPHHSERKKPPKPAKRAVRPAVPQPAAPPPLAPAPAPAAETAPAAEEAVTGAADVPAPRAPVDVPEDVRELAWWVIRGVVAGTFDARTGGVLVAAARLVAGLGPDVDSEEEALAATVLRGRVMHGVPPQDDDEWAMAEALFTASAVGDLRRWAERSLEGDLVDHLQPGGLFERAALEGELPVAVDVEDRVGGEF